MKSLSKIVAIAFIPCLTAGPSGSAALSMSPHDLTFGACSRFHEQALSAAAAGFVQPLGKTARIATVALVTMSGRGLAHWLFNSAQNQHPIVPQASGFAAFLSTALARLRRSRAGAKAIVDAFLGRLIQTDEERFGGRHRRLLVEAFATRGLSVPQNKNPSQWGDRHYIAPDGSPYTIWQILTHEGYFSAQELHDGLTVDQIQEWTSGGRKSDAWSRVGTRPLGISTIRRDLGALIRLGLVERVRTRDGNIYRPVYMESELPERLHEFIDDRLSELGPKPTRAMTNTARAHLDQRRLELQAAQHFSRLGIRYDDSPLDEPIWSKARATPFDYDASRARIRSKIVRLLQVLQEPIALHVSPGADFADYAFRAFGGHAFVVDPMDLRNKGVGTDAKVTDKFVDEFVDMSKRAVGNYGLFTRKWPGPCRPSLPLVLFMTQPDVNRTRTEGFFANVTFTFFVDNVRQRLVRAIHWRREELEGPSYFGIAYVIAERNLDMLLSIAQENERAVTALAKAYSSSHIESPFIVSVVHNAEFETLLSQVLLPPFIEKYLRLEKHWWYDEFELRAALSGVVPEEAERIFITEHLPLDKVLARLKDPEAELWNRLDRGVNRWLGERVRPLLEPGTSPDAFPNETPIISLVSASSERLSSKPAPAKAEHERMRLEIAA